MDRYVLIHFEIIHVLSYCYKPGGQLGSSQGGFDRTIGESQVTQVTTLWRLNVSANMIITYKILINVEIFTDQ